MMRTNDLRKHLAQVLTGLRGREVRSEEVSDQHLNFVRRFEQTGEVTFPPCLTTNEPAVLSALLTAYFLCEAEDPSDFDHAATMFARLASETSTRVAATV